MIIKIDPAGLRRSKFHEHLIRFLFGGLITVVVGWIAKEWGPVVAGLFLAFPAIFPASATLIESNQKRRGRERGIEAAGAEAWGAAIGSSALAVFAVICWKLLRSHAPALALALGVLAWLAVSIAAWFVGRRLRRKL